MIKKKISLLLFLITHSVYADWWAQAEFLFWAIKKNGTAIPFVTKASSSDALPGALGQPGTEVVLSSCSVSPTKHPGFRALLGTSIDEEKNIDLEANYFLLPSRSCKKSLATSGQPGSPNFAVPVFDTTGVWGLNGIPGETIAVLPGPLGSDPGFNGSFSVCSANRFQGAELQALFQCAEWNDWLWTATTGFAWMQLFESIVLNVKTSTDSNASIPFDFFNVTDQFNTKNNFFGLLLGLRTEYIHDFWRLQILVNGGFGAVQNKKIIQGSSQTESGNLFFLTANTGSELLQGGIFTQPSNIGCFSYHAASGMFETTMRFGYSVRENIEINAGYNCILLARLARAASIIDRQINSTRTSLADASRATVGIGPGPIPFGTPQAAPIAQGDNSPIALNHTRHFWAQGLSVGLMIYF